MRRALLLAAVLAACGDDSAAPDAAPPDAAPPDAAPTAVTLTPSGTLQTLWASGMGADHVAFPSVARLPDGRLLAVHREAAIHGVDPTGRIVGQYAPADASSWSDPVVLVDTPDVDDRDPSLLVLTSGEVLLSFFEYVNETVGLETLAVHQVFVARSSDGGATFAAAEQVSAGAMTYPGAYIDSDLLWKDSGGAPIEVWACSAPAIERAGQILLPVYGGNSWNVDNAASPRSRIGFLVSSDGGASFTPALLPAAATTWLQEPAVLDLGGDRLVVQLRTAPGASPGGLGGLWQTVSEDGGATWSSYTSFAFTGHAPDLQRLRGGAVLSAFRMVNAAATATDVGLITSLDEGATWSAPTQLLGWQPTETGYPSILQLDDGRVLLVFYVGGQSISAQLYDVAYSY